MKAIAAGVAFFVLSGDVALAGKLDVAYASLERTLVTTFLTEGGRRYLQGGPDDTCAYAFIQEPRVSAIESRLHLRFLFAGRAGKEVAGRCVGPGDNFEIVLSGIPRFEGGDIFLDDARFEADNTLFDVFSGLIESQLAPLLRIQARPHVERYFGELTSRGAGTVGVDTMTIESIELGPSSAIIDADIVVSIRP